MEKTMCSHDTPKDTAFWGKTKRFEVDACIASIVRALRQWGIKTLSSCCGHGQMHGSILLADGRCLVIMDREDHDRHFEQFPHTIHGEPNPPQTQDRDHLAMEALREMDVGDTMNILRTSEKEWHIAFLLEGGVRLVFDVSDPADAMGNRELIAALEGVAGAVLPEPTR